MVVWVGDSQGILGFTEAELGFFLALLCIVLWLASIPAKGAAAVVQITPDSLVTLKAKADTLIVVRRQVDSLDGHLVHERQVSDSLRSRLLPNCNTVSRAVGPLAVVAVHEGGEIVVGGSPTTLESFARQTLERRKTDEGVCRHQVVVRFADGLTMRQSEGVRRGLNGMGFRITTGEFLAPTR